MLRIDWIFKTTGFIPPVVCHRKNLHFQIQLGWQQYNLDALRSVSFRMPFTQSMRERLHCITDVPGLYEFTHESPDHCRPY